VDWSPLGEDDDWADEEDPQGAVSDGSLSDDDDHEDPDFVPEQDRNPGDLDEFADDVEEVRFVYSPGGLFNSMAECYGSAHIPAF